MSKAATCQSGDLTKCKAAETTCWISTWNRVLCSSQECCSSSLRYKGKSKRIGILHTLTWFNIMCASSQGLSPQIQIHRISDLSLLASISWNTEAGFEALAFSADGLQLAAIEQETPSLLTVWDWQEVKTLSCLGSCSLLQSLDRIALFA